MKMQPDRTLGSSRNPVVRRLGSTRCFKRRAKRNDCHVKVFFRPLYFQGVKHYLKFTPVVSEILMKPLKDVH